MKNKKVLLLVLATVLMLGLAVVAVVTSLKLRELSTVPVAPNVPVSQPRAQEAPVCQVSFTVAETTLSELACTIKNAYKTTVSTANKLAAGAEVGQGDTIVYEIGYENTGDAAGTITITDVLSDKLEFVSADTPCTYAAATKTVTCSAVSVAAGASGTKKITVKVLDTAAAGAFNNSAVVTPSEGEVSTCGIALTLNVSTSTPTPTPVPSASPTPSPSASPTPGPTAKPPACNDYCANASECPSGLICSANKCRNADCPTDNDCSCEQPPGCNEVCNPDSATNECVGGYICDRSTNTCRNSACTGEADCTCEIIGTTVTTQETLPEAGSPIPGFLFLGVGALLLILGVLVVGL
jgi:uncharacterized repeat protein (TIGR01451 family)